MDAALKTTAEMALYEKLKEDGNAVFIDAVRKRLNSGYVSVPVTDDLKVLDTAVKAWRSALAAQVKATDQSYAIAVCVLGSTFLIGAGPEQFVRMIHLAEQGDLVDASTLSLIIQSLLESGALSSAIYGAVSGMDGPYGAIRDVEASRSIRHLVVYCRSDLHHNDRLSAVAARIYQAVVVMFSRLPSLFLYNGYLRDCEIIIAAIDRPGDTPVSLLETIISLYQRRIKTAVATSGWTSVLKTINSMGDDYMKLLIAGAAEEFVADITPSETYARCLDYEHVSGGSSVESSGTARPWTMLFDVVTMFERGQRPSPALIVGREERSRYAERLATCYDGLSAMFSATVAEATIGSTTAKSARSTEGARSALFGSVVPAIVLASSQATSSVPQWARAAAALWLLDSPRHLWAVRMALGLESGGGSGSGGSDDCGVETMVSVARSAVSCGASACTGELLARIEIYAWAAAAGVDARLAADASRLYVSVHMPRPAAAGRTVITSYGTPLASATMAEHDHALLSMRTLFRLLEQLDTHDARCEDYNWHAYRLCAAVCRMNTLGAIRTAFETICTQQRPLLVSYHIMLFVYWVGVVHDYHLITGTKTVRDGADAPGCLEFVCDSAPIGRAELPVSLRFHLVYVAHCTGQPSGRGTLESLALALVLGAYADPGASASVSWPATWRASMPPFLRESADDGPSMLYCAAPAQTSFIDGMVLVATEIWKRFSGMNQVTLRDLVAAFVRGLDNLIHDAPERFLCGMWDAYRIVLAVAREHAADARSGRVESLAAKSAGKLGPAVAVVVADIVASMVSPVAHLAEFVDMASGARVGTDLLCAFSCRRDRFEMMERYAHADITDDRERAGVLQMTQAWFDVYDRSTAYMSGPIAWIVGPRVTAFCACVLQMSICGTRSISDPTTWFGAAKVDIGVVSDGGKAPPVQIGEHDDNDDDGKADCTGFPSLGTTDDGSTIEPNPLRRGSVPVDQFVVANLLRNWYHLVTCDDPGEGARAYDSMDPARRAAFFSVAYFGLDVISPMEHLFALGLLAEAEQPKGRLAIAWDRPNPMLDTLRTRATEYAALTTITAKLCADVARWNISATGEFYSFTDDIVFGGRLRKYTATNGLYCSVFLGVFGGVNSALTTYGGSNTRMLAMLSELHGALERFMDRGIQVDKPENWFDITFIAYESLRRRAADVTGYLVGHQVGCHDASI